MLSHNLRMIGGGFPNGYWTIEYTAGTSPSMNVAVDSSGDAYMLHKTAAAGGVFGITKATDRGTPLFSQKYTGESSMAAYGCVGDGAGGIFVSGIHKTSGDTNNSMMAVKLDGSGTVSAFNKMGDGGTTPYNAVSTTVKGDSNFWIGGNTTETPDSTSAGYVVGWNAALSSAPVDHRFTETGQQNYLTALGYGNSIVWMAVETSTGVDLINMAKNGSSEAGIQITSALTVSSLLADSAGNCYALVTSASALTLVKFSSAKAITWQRKVGPTDGTAQGMGLAFDSSGNIFVEHKSSSGTTLIYISKYNTSGVYQEGRSIALANTLTSATSNGFLIDDDKIILGAVDANSTWLMRLPTDGTQVGTHGDLTIASVTIADAAGALSTGTRATTKITGAAASPQGSSALTQASNTTSPTFTGIS